MGCVQQAVLEFDEEVQAPWRPRLVPQVGEVVSARPGPLRPSRPNPSRVGACRPPVPPARPVLPARRPTAPARRLSPGDGRPGREPRAVSARRSPEQLRLTRRARRLAVVLALACGVALGSWLGPLLNGGAGDLRLAGQSTVTVESGDTLWSIASSMAGDGDVRVVVDQIRQLNGLKSADIVPGQVLELP